MHGIAVCKGGAVRARNTFGVLEIIAKNIARARIKPLNSGTFTVNFA